ncbi:MAG: pitrilysin family protein [Bacteroidota bacterium]
MKHLLSLLLTVGMLGLHGQNSKSSTNLNMEMYTLPNGLKVYLNEDHSQPEIYGGVAINAGSKQDPSDATGIAHYLEHMLFKGTETMGTTDFSQEKAHQDRIVELYDELAQTTDEEARKNIHKQINEESIKAAEFGINNEFDKLLKSIGSTGVNAFTSFEITFYHNTFPPNQVQKWLDIYAHRFQKPVFRTFQAELEVVYEEKNRAMDGFGYSIFETFLSNLFKNHPYGQQTTLGKTEHLKNPPLRKMYEFFDQYYVANNMALILCGDFNPEEVKPYIEASFGQLKSGEVPPYPEFPEAPFAGREEVKMRAAPVKIGALAFRTVPHMHPDRTTLEVADYILSNYSETGLLDKLALDGKLLMAQSQLLVNKDHGAQIYIFLPKIVGQSLNKAEDLVLTEIRKLAQGDFDEKLLEAAKLEMILEFEESLEDFENRGDLIGYSFVYGESWEEFMSFPGRVRNITKADVQKAAQSYFGENYLVLHSGRGFSKKDKIEKPDIEPVKPKEGNKSAYATYFEALPELEGSPRFVDFEKDIQARSLPGKSVLYQVSQFYLFC